MCIVHVMDVDRFGNGSTRCDLPPMAMSKYTMGFSGFLGAFSVAP
jgi:hypothetical protein